jgi:NitT/TauT family transport system substrate-binding protein
MRTFIYALLALICLIVPGRPAAAEQNEIRISKQPGLQYLPLLVMEQNRLVEKHAQQLGLKDVKVSWLLLNSGGTAVDALLSGNLDVVGSGVSNMLVAWSGTGGQIKGVAPLAAVPVWFVSKNPNVKTLKDLGAADKMAVPTVRVSMQSTIMAVAADKLYGPNDLHHFDPMTVALGHPDAMIALQSGSGSVNAHASSPPYQGYEVKIPGVHTIANSYDILGGPADLTAAFASAKFHDTNPKLYAAFIAALKDADEVINRDHRNAALIYLQQSHEKWPLDDVIKLLDDKGMVFQPVPLRTYTYADIMYRAGTIKTKAATWKDYWFPEIAGLQGS